MPPVGFEPTIPADERPQTYVLDGAATGIGKHWYHNTIELMCDIISDCDQNIN